MKIYFIGICGVMMAPLAVAFKMRGDKVEGSDKGFYPPMSSVLEENGIKMHIGFKESHIPKDSDYVIVGASILPSNPEFMYVKMSKIPYSLGYAPVLEKYLIKDNSVVVIGTYGKTTITGFLSHLLTLNNDNPNFAIGGIPLNASNGVAITESNWSIVEGDEYLNSRLDPIAKFMYYHPKYLLVNAIKYDHLDFYKTEDAYLDSFLQVLGKVPPNGKIIANSDGENMQKVIDKLPSKEHILYVSTKTGNKNFCDVALLNYQYEKETISFTVKIYEEEVKFTSPLIGLHNIQNLVMGIAFAVSIHIELSIIKEAILTYKGIRRRLEVRSINSFLIIDDLAHSPVKAQSSILAVKEKYPDRQIIAIFEPHTLSSRLHSSLNSFRGYFDKADKVFIAPVYHPAAVPMHERVTSHEIAKIIGASSEGFDSFQALQETIISTAKYGDILLFMTSGNMGGLIEYFSKPT